MAPRASGAMRAGDGRSGSADEAVDDDGDAPRRRTQHHAGDGRDLQTANAAQHFEGVWPGGGIISEMPPQSFVDDLRLRHAPLVIEAGACAGQLRDGASGERRRDGGRRTGVADAHLAQRDQGAALSAGFGRQIDADLERGVQFGFRHRRFAGKVAGAAPHFAMLQSRDTGEVGIHSHVDYHNVRPGMPGQNVDGRSTVQEVAHHLLRHLARIGADALVGDAVIGGEDIHRFAGNARNIFFAPGDVLRRHRFQLTQAAQRLGQAIQMLLRLPPAAIVDRANIGDGSLRLPHSA